MSLFIINTKKQTGRALPVILSTFLILSVSLSLIFLIHEADHECTGEHCPVCSMMQSAADNIQSLSNILNIQVLSLILPATAATVIDKTPDLFYDNTLVGRKIRLND